MEKFCSIFNPDPLTFFLNTLLICLEMASGTMTRGNCLHVFSIFIAFFASKYMNTETLDVTSLTFKLLTYLCSLR